MKRIKPPRCQTCGDLLAPPKADDRGARLCADCDQAAANQPTDRPPLVIACAGCNARYVLGSGESAVNTHDRYCALCWRFPYEPRKPDKKPAGADGWIQETIDMPADTGAYRALVEGGAR